MKRSLCIGVAGLLLASTGSVAPAQEAVVEGPGYPIGEATVLHPSVSLLTGYVSNVFYEDVTPVASALVRLIGSFSIASQTHKEPADTDPDIVAESDAADADAVDKPPPNLDFRFGGQLTLHGYLSGNGEVRNQTDFALTLDGHVIAFPQGNVSFSADDVFIRDARPKNFEDSGNLNRDYNHLKLGVKYQPGGRTISFGIRYENVIDRFEGGGEPGSVLDLAGRFNHLIAARAEWRWLPVTKFFFDASLGFFGSLGDSMGFKQSSMPLRIQLGVGTALTELTTLRAHLGYANGFYSAGPNFNMAIGGVEFGYRYTQYGRFRLTAEYDFKDSIQANFYRDYAFLAKVDQQFGLVVAGAEGGLRLRGYRGIPAAIGPPSRDDLLVSLVGRVNYMYREWLAFTGRLELTIDETDYRYMAGPRTDDPSFTRVEALVGVSAAF